MSERDFDPLEPDLEQLLHAERQRPDPSGEAHDRVLARVCATLGAGDLGGGPDGGGPSGPGGSALSGAAANGGSVGNGLLGGLAGKTLAVGLALVALGGAGAGLYASLRPDAAQTITAVPAPPFKLPAMTDPESASDVAPAFPAPSSPHAKAAPEPPPRSTSAAAARAPASAGADRAGHDASLAAERALLETARAALARRQGAAAFEALTRHAQAFPRGRLGEEREGLWIHALLQAGRRDEARARFERFRRSYPRSMLIPAFEASLPADSVTDSARPPQ